MKFISYYKNDQIRAALLVEEKIYDLQDSAKKISITLPSSMAEFLMGEEANMNAAKKVYENIKDGKIETSIEREKIKLAAPVPNPTSCRDGYAFRQHVATARRNRGVEMIPEFDQFPIFYFTNHNAIFGEGEIIVEEDHLQKLDFELEAAVVIGKRGKNISSSDADDYIAGYMIMNDFSARHLQMEEMKLNLGPAKGKDFATSIGPFFITPDELKPYLQRTDFGNKYNLIMKAFHNGKLVSEGNLNQMDWTFAEIIERVSYGVEIFPGDVIGSGTVGTGCYLELNGTRALEARESGEEFTPVWLSEGDLIELEIEALGKLSNTIIKSAESYSILSKKKMNKRV
jgi:fumarylacetoacetate (FAA) hydrolase